MSCRRPPVARRRRAGAASSSRRRRAIAVATLARVMGTSFHRWLSMQPNAISTNVDEATSRAATDVLWAGDAGHAEAAAAELATVFKALADPTRVAIVNRLAAASEVCVCDLTAAFELSQPTISHHLRLLRDAGLVEAERRGTWAYYRLVPEAIERLRAVFDAARPSARLPEPVAQPTNPRCCSSASTTPAAARWRPAARHARSAGRIARPLGRKRSRRDEINPAVVEAMAEVGVDLSEQFPKPLTDEAVRAADVVITMGCGDACPIYPGKRYEDWQLDDPAGQDLDTVRRIRDEIDAERRAAPP